MCWILLSEIANLIISISRVKVVIHILEPQNSDPKLEEGQACGCDYTMTNCLGTCKAGLECKYEDVTVGNGVCTKIQGSLQS